MADVYFSMLRLRFMTIRMVRGYTGSRRAASTLFRFPLMGDMLRKST